MKAARAAGAAIVTAAVLLSACSNSGGGQFDPGPAPGEDQALPLGSQNPCWAGVYPDDLQGVGIAESDILVDLQTNDMYDSVCIEARVSQYNEQWPAGMANRLVRASDL